MIAIVRLTYSSGQSLDRHKYEHEIKARPCKPKASEAQSSNSSINFTFSIIIIIIILHLNYMIYLCKTWIQNDQYFDCHDVPIQFNLV